MKTKSGCCLPGVSFLMPLCVGRQPRRRPAKSLAGTLRGSRWRSSEQSMAIASSLSKDSVTQVETTDRGRDALTSLPRDLGPVLFNGKNRVHTRSVARWRSGRTGAPKHQQDRQHRQHREHREHRKYRELAATKRAPLFLHHQEVVARRGGALQLAASQQGLMKRSTNTKVLYSRKSFTRRKAQHATRNH